MLVPGQSSYDEITSVRLSLSGLQSLINYSNASVSIFSFMVIPIWFVSQDLAHRCFQSALTDFSEITDES